jgi:HSP20 family protein
MSLPRKPTPLPDLALLHREVNLLFQRLAELEPVPDPHPGSWQPPVDCYEAKGHMVVVVEVPGLAPESVQVSVRDRQLVISGERRVKRLPAGQCGFLCMERAHGRFVRVLPLDAAVDVRGAHARLARGVLTIELPRLKDRRGAVTQIPIQRENPE